MSQDIRNAKAGRKTVMISSTARDLPDHRKSVLDACLQQGMFPIMMEHLPASDSDAISESLNMVDQVGIYLGIFAHRYGYIPKGHDISITEMEYNRAIERGIPRLIFIMHDDHPIKAADMEKGEAAIKLDKLKERMKSENIVNFFKSPAELSAQVINSLSNYQRDLTASHYVMDTPTPSVPLQRPRRAEHFVDRETEKAKLLADLQPGRVVTICGPGGMGKTALVAEVLWTLAPDNNPPAAFLDGVLFYSFYGQPQVTIALEQLARTLGEDPLPTPALAAQRALSGKHTLLILDGAEEADHLDQMLSVCADSAILVTSRKRADAPDPAYRLDLRPLPQEESISVVQAFGGNRANDSTATSEICSHVGNLPLALRLVGRYLSEQEEDASDYLAWLERTPLAALDQGRSHQQSVRVLLDRSITQLSTNAQQVLSVIGLLALAPFERGIVAQVLELSPEAAGQALGELVNYGLLLRQQSKYEVSHPLIHTYAHEVLLARDKSARQSSLAEQVVRVLNEQFPKVDYTTWARCEELLPHVQACTTLIDQHQFVFSEAAYLLIVAGWYLREQAQYTQAELLLQQALALAEQAPDETSSGLGSIFNNLALLYGDLGQYTQAIPYAQRAVDFDEKTRGTDHPETAKSFDNLARLYQAQGQYAQAEPLLQRVLAIMEHALPPDHSDTATALNNLALLYQNQRKYTQAELLYQRSLAIKEKVLPPNHPSTALTLDNLARLYQAQGQYVQAEILYRRALVIQEKVLPSNHPSTALTLGNLAGLYFAQGQYAQAEPLIQRALAIIGNVLPADHPDLATGLENYADLLRKMQRPTEAEAVERRAKEIRAKRQS